MASCTVRCLFHIALWLIITKLFGWYIEQILKENLDIGLWKPSPHGYKHSRESSPLGFLTLETRSEHRGLRTDGIGSRYRRHKARF
jgi:hypothetical protein